MFASGARSDAEPRKRSLVPLKAFFHEHQRAGGCSVRPD
jgi:hypothetical protein